MLLVTGISGHTGRYFVQELVNKGYEGTIRCVVRTNSNTNILDASGLKIEKVYGDLNEQKFIDGCMEDIDTILHIAGIQMTIPVIKAAVKSNVRRVILVHTTGIYSKYKTASWIVNTFPDNLLSGCW